MKPIPCGLASDAAATVLDEAARRRWLQQLEDDRSRFLQSLDETIQKERRRRALQRGGA